MKTLPRITKAGLFIAGALCLTFCATMPFGNRYHNVVFLPEGYDTADQIVLRGTEISADDEKALLDALKGNELYYTVKRFEPNLVPEVIGKLPFPECLNAHQFDPGLIDDGNKIGVTRAKGGFSRWSRVVGMGCVTRVCPPSTRPRHSGYTRRSKEASKELVDKIKPILQKYQQTEKR